MRDLIIRAMQLRTSQTREPMTVEAVHQAVGEITVLTSPSKEDVTESLRELISEGTVTPKADGYALTDAGLRIRA